MKKETRVVKNTKVANEANKFYKVIREYFDKDLVSFDKKDNFIFCPFGVVSYEQEFKLWTFSFDFNWIENINANHSNNSTINVIFNFVMDLLRINSKIAIAEGFYTVFNDQQICVGSLFTSEIEQYSEENKLDYSISKNILTQKMILESQQISEKN